MQPHKRARRLNHWEISKISLKRLPWTALTTIALSLPVIPEAKG